MPEFTPWPKIQRLFREVLITEKLDGTNSAVGVTDDGEVYAQSRKRIITPGKSTDNYGFAAWVHTNREAMVELLGPGVHFGEWIVPGIHGGYGLEGPCFALFNAPRWQSVLLPPRVTTVPVLYQGIFDQDLVKALVDDLRENGSRFVQGQPAEGLIVYHSAANIAFKVLCENDDIPKSVVAETEAATALAAEVGPTVDADTEQLSLIA